MRDRGRTIRKSFSPRSEKQGKQVTKIDGFESCKLKKDSVGSERKESKQKLRKAFKSNPVFVQFNFLVLSSFSSGTLRFGFGFRGGWVVVGLGWVVVGLGWVVVRLG